MNKNAPILCIILIKEKYFNPFDKLRSVCLVTIQKYESLTWEIIIDPDPMDNIIIVNSYILKPKSEIIGKIIELTMIIEEVLDPWLVFNNALHINPIKHK